MGNNVGALVFKLMTNIDSKGMNKFHVNIATEDQPYKASIYCQNQLHTSIDLEGPKGSLGYTLHGIPFNDDMPTPKPTSSPTTASPTYMPTPKPTSSPTTASPTYLSPSVRTAITGVANRENCLQKCTYYFDQSSEQEYISGCQYDTIQGSLSIISQILRW